MASRFNKLVGLFEINRDIITLGGGLLGSNIGVFTMISDDTSFEKDITKVMWGATVGGAAGICAGILFPILFPVAVCSTPGYIAAKIHTYSQESRKKEGTPEVRLA